MSDSLRPCGLQHARLPSPSPSPGVCSDSCPLLPPPFFTCFLTFIMICHYFIYSSAHLSFATVSIRAMPALSPNSTSDIEHRSPYISGPQNLLLNESLPTWKAQRHTCRHWTMGGGVCFDCSKLQLLGSQTCLPRPWRLVIKLQPDVPCP